MPRETSPHEPLEEALPEARPEAEETRQRMLAAAQRILGGGAGSPAEWLEMVIQASQSIDSAVVVEPPAAARGEPWLFHTGGEPFPPLPAGTVTVYAVPLVENGAVVGTALAGSRSALDLSPQEKLLVQLAARRIEGARAQARLEQALQESERQRETAERHAAEVEEAARHTAAFRDQILGIVGHDLRNPLGAIVMSAALLQKKGGLAGWQAKTVERMRSSAGRMGRIINDLLSYTRTRLGGGIPMERRPADLGEITRKVCDELAAANPDRAVRCEAEGDLTGEWDPDRLEQVFSNLVSNALDHGEPEVPVTVTARGGGAEVEVQVRNRGAIPPEVLERAFEPFHRGPEGGSRKASGLGLGLYIAKVIVQGHGGEIALRCEGEADASDTVLSVSLPRRG
ncbi:MAG TPA: HAMP domain-containing sensor histidine kinase [Anaeromyxobacteraceae bacterium]|nr:HAMP domain-containing sensor histidine kinase [Anaeromyxobacteraceae bacterium]